MFKLKYSALAAASALAIMAADVTVRVNSFIGVSNGSTAAILALNVFVMFALLFLARKTDWKRSLPRPAQIIFSVLLLWSLVVLFRGALEAPDYWAWKALATNHLFMYLVPLSIVVGLNSQYLVRVHYTILFLILPAALLLVPVAISFDTELFQRAAMPVFMLLLLFPFLERRWKLVVLAVAAATVFMDLSYRANVLRIVVAGTLAIMFMMRLRLRLRLRAATLNAIMLASLILPPLLLGLGLSGTYNVFREGISFEGFTTVVEGGEVRESSLAADTRTFLYDEVITSMQRRDSSFVFGQGAGTGYDSSYFSDAILGASGRLGSEVGFLNTLLYSGLTGVLLYAAMLFLAAYYAFNRSNNDLCKMLGLFLMFKWMLFFVEDIPKMDLNFFCTWVIVGLCLSPAIRQLDNAQLKELLSRKASARPPTPPRYAVRK